MKILLIVPNINSRDVMPCLSVATLKGFIKGKTKHEAKIADLAFHRKDWKNYIDKIIRAEKPDIIGFSVSIFCFTILPK